MARQTIAFHRTTADVPNDTTIHLHTTKLMYLIGDNMDTAYIGLYTMLLTVL